MTSNKPDVSTSASVSAMEPHPMIPGVGADIGAGPDEQLSSVPEDPEESVRGEKRNSKVPLLSDMDAESSQNTDEDTPNDITEIEGAIPASQLGDDDQDTATDTTSIPSVVFILPFPPPVNGHRSKKTSPFLMYTLPRAGYVRPPKGEDGKRPNEKLFKKLVRHYQQEVRFGEQLKRKEVTKTGPMKKLHKARACCIRGASMLTKWLPSPCVETLARLPPKHKLGEVVMLYPVYAGEVRPEGEDQPYTPTAEDLRHDITVLFRRTRKRIILRLVASAAFMPIAAGADFFAPCFLVEITLAYVAFQIYGLKKIKALTSTQKPKKSKSKKSKKQLTEKKPLAENTLPGEPINGTDDLAGENVEDDLTPTDRFRITPGDQAIFEPLLPLMYNICSRIDPLAFPPVAEEAVVLNDTEADSEATPEAGPSSQQTADQAPKSKRTQLPRTLHKPDPIIVRELIAAFRAHLPQDVQDRHILDEDRVSEDLARYMKKSAAEYVASLKGRPERSALKVTKKWLAKRKTVHQERKEKRQIKKQIKLEAAEDLANSPPQEQPDDVPAETAPDPKTLPQTEGQPTTQATPEPASQAETAGALEAASVSPEFESKKAMKARLASEQKAEKQLLQKAKDEAREQEKAAKAEARQQQKAAKAEAREQEKATKQAKKEKKRAE